MFEYFYHGIIRKTVIAFGTLFNNISIKHTNDAGDSVSVINVPLAYGPTQKFLARLQQVPNLNKPVQVSLPRMSFELINISYDASRKKTTTQAFLTKDVNNNEIRRAYLPVPYNLNFELSIITKLNDDMLQIIEQIIPYFQPEYTLSINLVEEIGEKRDIPIVLDNIVMTDNYEGDYTERRALIYTLKFTAKTYLFGPVSGGDVSNSIIERVSIGYVASNTPRAVTYGGVPIYSSDLNKNIIDKVSMGLVAEDSNERTRDITYTANKRSIKNYTGSVTTLLSDDIDSNEIFIKVDNASSIPIDSYIDVNSEEMYVISKVENTIKVIRGQDKTSMISHVKGSEVKLITSSDNNLIEPGDDFGFSGSLS